MGEQNGPKPFTNGGPGPSEELSPPEYLRVVKTQLAKGKRADAYALLQQAEVLYPDDPRLLSYYGYLEALVDGKYRNGIESCTKAIVLFEKKTLLGDEDAEEKFFPELYLNLGKAYLAAGRKAEAIEAFQKGLKHDRHHADLLRELRALGTRRNPVVSFLDRSNLINKYLGLMRHKSATGRGRSGPG